MKKIAIKEALLERARRCTEEAGYASVEELVDFVVSRILSRVGVGTALHPRWGEATEGEEDVGAIKTRRAEPLRRLRRNR